MCFTQTVDKVPHSCAGFFCAKHRKHQYLYTQRKETIERLFGTAKENHGFDIHRCMEKPGKNEGQDNVCVYELEKIRENQGKIGIVEGKKNTQNFYFEHNSF